jgi:hypothetical protein
MTKVSGLESLGKLAYVHVEGPSNDWLNKLPLGVKRLFLTKSKLEHIDLSKFRNLDVLGFASQKRIAAKDFLLPQNLKQLDLVQVLDVLDFDNWLASCKKLNKINLDTCPEELLTSIGPAAQTLGIRIEVG